MGDRSREQRDDTTAEGLAVAAGRHGRIWYSFSLTMFLLAPSLVALAVMGWLKAP